MSIAVPGIGPSINYDGVDDGEDASGRGGEEQRWRRIGARRWRPLPMPCGDNGRDDLDAQKAADFPDTMAVAVVTSTAAGQEATKAAAQASGGGALQPRPTRRRRRRRRGPVRQRRVWRWQGAMRHERPVGDRLMPHSLLATNAERPNWTTPEHVSNLGRHCEPQCVLTPPRPLPALRRLGGGRGGRRARAQTESPPVLASTAGVAGDAPQWWRRPFCGETKKENSRHHHGGSIMVSKEMSTTGHRPLLP